MDLDKKLKKIVADFFKAFDEKDTSKISQMCAPKTTIVHNNGVVTSLAEMIKIIDNTKNWYPRTRKLSEYMTLLGNQYSIIGFKNVVIFKLPDGKNVKEKYRETWVFKMGSPNNWKPIRIHYSSITKEKHSEDVI